jgi:dienelactone hydrolase
MFAGFFFEPETPLRRAAVMVLHGGAGLSGHERERARMLSEAGYVAFTPDLFGEPFLSREHGVEVITRLIADTAGLRGRLDDALACLRAHAGVDAARIAAIGFCFGGLAALELARSGADLRAVVSFHGGLTTRAPAEPSAVQAAILACAGAADPFVPREHRTSFEEEMTKAGADWQLHIYSGAMHGFTERPTEGRPPRPGCGYDPTTDRRSWTAMLALLSEAMG